MKEFLCALNHKNRTESPLILVQGHACKFTKYFYLKLLDYFGIKDEEELEICHTPYQLVYASDKALDLLKCDVRNARLQTAPKEEKPLRKKMGRPKTSYYYINEWGTKYRKPMDQGLYFDLVDVVWQTQKNEVDDENLYGQHPANLIHPPVKNWKITGQQAMQLPYPRSSVTAFSKQAPLVYGYENWFMMMGAEPERCRKFMDKLLEKKIEYYDNLFEVYDGLVDVTAEADDFGTQLGLMVSPKCSEK